MVNVDTFTWPISFHFPKDRLTGANMRVSEDVSFFKTSVEYLGFIVSRNGICTSPDKIKIIMGYKTSETFFGVSSFLGLASYYRCFVKDFASMEKPLTYILKCDKGNVSTYQSRKVLN